MTDLFQNITFKLDKSGLVYQCPGDFTITRNLFRISIEHSDKITHSDMLISTYISDNPNYPNDKNNITFMFKKSELSSDDEPAITPALLTTPRKIYGSHLIYSINKYDYLYALNKTDMKGVYQYINIAISYEISGKVSYGSKFTFKLSDSVKSDFYANEKVHKNLMKLFYGCIPTNIPDRSVTGPYESLHEMLSKGVKVKELLDKDEQKIKLIDGKLNLVIPLKKRLRKPNVMKTKLRK
ncbi:MAG: hypothetical protein ACOCRK_03765 [bacterium]